MASNGHTNFPFIFSNFELIKQTRKTGSTRDTLMEGGTTTPKAAGGLLVVSPLLFKAGIPLFLSVTGFVCARIIIAARTRSTTRTGCGTVSSPTASQVNMTKAHGTDPSDEIRGDIMDDGSICSDGLISTCTDSDRIERDLLIMESHSSLNLELLALSREITDQRERESTLELRFLRYCKLKERESELLEIGYMLQLGRAQLELLSREIARMEQDGRFLVEFSEECQKALEEVSYRRRVEKLRFRSRIKKLKRRVKMGRIKQREGWLKIEEKERELVEMRKENDELREKLAAAEKSTEAEETELVYLRWSNACLKHELTKNHGQEKQEDVASSVNKEEEGGRAGPGPGAAPGTGAGDDCVLHSPKKGRPPKIMKKLKRWGGWIGGDDSKVNVNPSEDADEKKHDTGFFPRHHPV